MYHTIASKAMRVFLSLVVLLSFSWGDRARAGGADDLELRVMSFNIRYGSGGDGENHWPNRREMVFDVIRKQNSDVVGLQEALRFQIDEIRAALPMYGEIGVAREDGRTDGEYSAILFRADRFGVAEAGTFWLSDTPGVVGSNQWGGACVRICTWARLIENSSGKAFYIFNTHLDHRSQPSREKSAVLLARRIANRTHGDPFVLTGDFNAGEDNPAVTYLTGKTGAESPVTMVDTFRVLHPNARDVRTHHAFKGIRQGSKIDYVLAPRTAEVLEAEILYDNTNGRYPSDHYPVSARLRLPVAGKR